MICDVKDQNDQVRHLGQCVSLFLAALYVYILLKLEFPMKDLASSLLQCLYNQNALKEVPF